MKRLFLSGLVINIIVMGINLLTGILSARYLGPDARGVMAIAVRWSGLFSMLFTIGLSGAVIYLGKQNPSKRQDYFGVFLLLGTIVGVIGLIFGEYMLPLLIMNQPQSVIFLAKIAMIGVPLGVLADGIVGTLQTLNLFGKVMILRVLSPIGTLFIIFILLVLKSYTVGIFIVISMIWSLVIFIVPVIWVCRHFRPRLTNVWSTGKQLFLKGIQIYTGALVSVFGVNLDHLIMSIFLTTYTLGLYTVSSSIGSMLPSVIIGTFGMYLFPKLMDMAQDERHKKVERFHGALFYATAVLSLTGIILLPYLLPFFYGQEYTDSILMGQILLISAPIQVVYVVLMNLLSTEGKFFVATQSEIIGLTIGLITMYLLLHILEGVGAAIGVTVAAYVKWAFAAYRCTKLGITVSGLFSVHLESFSILKKKVSNKGMETTSDQS